MPPLFISPLSGGHTQMGCVILAQLTALALYFMRTVPALYLIATLLPDLCLVVLLLRICWQKEDTVSGQED